MQWGANSRLQRFWDLRAACNFIGGGTGSSILMWAALGLLAAGIPYYPAAIPGLALIGFGLFMVWLEIGKPWRAFRVFFRPQTSWMTREGIVAMPLFALGALAILFDTGLQLPWAVPSPDVPAVLAAFLGLGFLYCQIRILNSARGLPAWREPRVMLLMGLSGLCEGLGLYLFIAAIQGFLPKIILAIALVLLLGRVLAWRSYILALRRAAVPDSTLATFTTMQSSFLLIGHLLPAVLIVVAVTWADMATIFSALGGITATLAGWWLKAVLVTRAAYIPGADIPNPPVRGRPSPTTGPQRTA